MVVIVVNQYNRESSCHTHDLLINPFLSHRFIDGTFKVVRKPFVQLLTVNAFVKKGEAIKQLAFLYIIMSRRKKKDYVAVSCRLMEVLGYIKTFKLFPCTPEIALDREPVTEFSRHLQQLQKPWVFLDEKCCTLQFTSIASFHLLLAQMSFIHTVFPLKVLNYLASLTDFDVEVVTADYETGETESL